MCSVSGGADSDVVIDMLTKIRKDIDYVWFDTGMEYQATKDHLDWLEKEYGIRIERIKVDKPIPVSCKKWGQPFLSKHVSEMAMRLQLHGFLWEDKPYEELIKEYPHCKSALEWWCNRKTPSLNISKNKYLKEFMVENPPKFKIASRCCEDAKKKPAHAMIEERKYDLSIVGVRRAEGGVRSIQYKSCFTEDNGSGCSFYRPLYWYKNIDRKQYCDHYGIRHSACYTDYGLKRTGCVGCPCAQGYEVELEVLKKHEPKLYRAACNVFKDSYEYSRQYRQYREAKEQEKNRK